MAVVFGNDLLLLDSMIGFKPSGPNFFYCRRNAEWVLKRYNKFLLINVLILD